MLLYAVCREEIGGGSELIVPGKRHFSDADMVVKV
jgi:hypothetical protein